jgi:hypothetical protein
MLDKMWSELAKFMNNSLSQIPSGDITSFPLLSSPLYVTLQLLDQILSIPSQIVPLRLIGTVDLISMAHDLNNKHNEGIFGLTPSDTKQSEIDEMNYCELNMKGNKNNVIRSYEFF